MALDLKNNKMEREVEGREKVVNKVGESRPSDQEGMKRKSPPHFSTLTLMQVQH